jgi:hypothetical protein
MATPKRRWEKAESHGTPRPELVKEWVGFMKAMQGIPGIPLIAIDEIIEAARAKAAKGWTPGEMWLQTLQQAWEERHQ